MTLSHDTIQTVARFLLKAATGALVAHGVQHANDLNTPVVQTVLEEALATALAAASLWWSKVHQTKIAATGNTTTFTKPQNQVNPPPSIPVFSPSSSSSTTIPPKAP